VVAAGPGQPSSVTVGFTLPPGSYGIALQMTGVYQNYDCCVATTYSTAELTLTSGASATGAIGTAICCTPRDWNGAIHYVPAGSGTVARALSYGSGCYSSRDGAFYELFNAGLFDLSNTSFQMLYTGASYLVMPGSSNWFTPVAAGIALTDDSVSTAQALGFTLPFVGGSTTDVWISSNGFVFLEASTANGCCIGSSATLLAHEPRVAAIWGDLNPGTGGSVHFDQDPANGAAYVTFVNVPEYSQTNTNTFQVAFFNSGVIEVRYQGCANTSHTVLAGFSPGHGVLDPGPTDLSNLATAPLQTGSFQIPLKLDASARPLLGTSFGLVTSQIPAGCPIGATLFGLAGLNPGIDLTSLGMAGCYQYVSMDANALFFPTGTSVQFPATLPNDSSFLGIHIYVQAAAYVPGVNVRGFLSSNGIDLTIGDL